MAASRTARLQFLALALLLIYRDSFKKKWGNWSWWSTKIEDVLFWGVVIVVVVPLGYLTLSGLCWTGVDCTFASPHLANSLFGQ